MNAIQRDKILNAGRFAVKSCLSILLATAGLLQAQTATIVGYPSNFDAVNNTGEVTHGFEIEADGISSSDLLGIFGGNFNGSCLIRYCQGTARWIFREASMSAGRAPGTRAPAPLLRARPCRTARTRAVRAAGRAALGAPMPRPVASTSESALTTRPFR